MIKDIRNGVWYKSDGSGDEVCMRNLGAGEREYARRRRIAWEIQGERCGICGDPMPYFLAVTDHINPRGMGGARRDDRQENIQAVHALCNSAKGSKRL